MSFDDYPIPLVFKGITASFDLWDFVSSQRTERVIEGCYSIQAKLSLKIPTFKITPSSKKMNSTRKKPFELSHHLGNVRSVIADVKLNESLAGGGMEHRAEIVMSSDYYPFGMT